MAQPGHALPKSTIVGTYIGLLVLAALMIGTSRLPVDKVGIDWLDLHAVKTCITMLIGLMMGSIIALFLMGLKYDHKLLNVTIFLSNFVFLLIFVLFTWADTSFRGEVEPQFNEKINFTSPVKSEPAGGEGAMEGKATEKPASETAVPKPMAAP